MSNCKSEYKSFVPLKKVVSAAIIDSHEEIGKCRELYTHWAARGLRKLERESLKSSKKRVLLPVNRNTMTATLPPDFKEEMYVGVYDEKRGVRKPIYKNENIVGGIDVDDFEDKCESCKQPKGICNDLETVETEETVIINGSAVVKKTIKKIYPDGKYYLEEIIPYWNTVTESIEYVTTKKYLGKFDVLPCGCISDIGENKKLIKKHCPSVYACYYSKCNDKCDIGIGSYNILEEQGLIQLSYNYPYEYVYLEYLGFMNKVNGEFVVPEVAFETLVEYVKFKAYCNRKNTALAERNWYFQNYDRERRNMMKVLGRLSLSQIIMAARSLPNFQIVYKDDCYPCCVSKKSNVYRTNKRDVCASVIKSCPAVPNKCLTPFTLALKVGEGGFAPEDGEYSFTHPELIGAVNLEYLIIDNNNESKKYGDFTFDSTTGTITRVNKFMLDSVVIIPFAKYV